MRLAIVCLTTQQPLRSPAVNTAGTRFKRAAIGCCKHAKRAFECTTKENAIAHLNCQSTPLLSADFQGLLDLFMHVQTWSMSVRAGERAMQDVALVVSGRE